ncbi:hypothetical protein COO60DRAFT_521048 [Scenedesmus sp. NREL 46B-D3]|nr:hypothetical protein COO60DRAFT_521048 [Scenedesmus sp. NREL 46B-D3]
MLTRSWGPPCLSTSSQAGVLAMAPPASCVAAVRWVDDGTRWAVSSLDSCGHSLWRHRVVRAVWCACACVAVLLWHSAVQCCIMQPACLPTGWCCVCIALAVHAAGVYCSAHHAVQMASTVVQLARATARKPAPCQLSRVAYCLGLGLLLILYF